MIAVPPGVRVYLACGTTDMRRYAESPVMRSRALEASIALAYQAILPRIISASVGALQHRHELVGNLEFSSLQAERRHGGEGFQFFRWICPKVGLCALEAGVAKPARPCGCRV